MPSLGITGGIATGKSSFTKLVSRLIPSQVFDADDYSTQLLNQNPQVQSELRQHFGDFVFTTDGLPDRTILREIVFQDPTELKFLEGILHPRIRQCWTSLAAAAKTGRDWLIVDIPLLFETNAESYFNHVLVVGCSPETQTRRLIENRSLLKEMASRIINSQFELQFKMNKAEHVIWNEGSLSCLEEQASLTAEYFKKCHG